ncbi:hypothetical protein ACFE04_030260 [Oxalis oulophora]
MTYFSSKGEAYGIQIRSTLIGFGNGFQASPPHRMLSKALELSNKTAFNFADRATSSQTKFIPRFSRQCRVFFFAAPNVEREQKMRACIDKNKESLLASKQLPVKTGHVMASLDMRIIYGVFRAAKNNQTPPSGSCLAREDDGTCLAGVPDENSHRHLSIRMTLFKFFVIILPVMIEEGKMRCPESFPERLKIRLSNYVSLRTPSGLSWIVTVIKSSDDYLYLGGPGWLDFATHHSLSFGHFLVFDCKQVDLFEVIICAQSGVEISYPAADLPPNPSGHGVSDHRISEFKKVMTSSDITGKQTIGIPAWFVNQNRSWFNSRHDDCSVSAAGEEKKNCRISWHHREGRWEGAICSGGWKFAVDKLKPSFGDTVEFNLVFYIRILETGLANGMSKLEVGSSSRSKRRV